MINIVSIPAAFNRRFLVLISRLNRATDTNKPTSKVTILIVIFDSLSLHLFPFYLFNDIGHECYCLPGLTSMLILKPLYLKGDLLPTDSLIQ